MSGPSGERRAFRVRQLQRGKHHYEVPHRCVEDALDSAERLLDAFTLLHEAQHLERDIERCGQPTRKVYDMR